jgi:O-antigen ligase
LYLAVQSFIPVKALTRLETTQADITEGGLTGRTELWRGAWDVFLSHPLLGIGGGAFRSVDLESGKVEHNLVLALLAELGIIGFVLFVAIICSALACMGRQPGELLWMWVGVFTGWFLAAGLHNWEYRKQTWFLFALIIAGGNLLKGGDSSDSTTEALPPPGVGHPQRGAVRAPLP